MRRPDPRVVCVVVPAHDEEDLLPSCLRSLDVAGARVADVVVEVVVVANGCRDRTAEVARVYLSGRDGAERFSVEVIELEDANVGRARSAGFAHLLDRHAAHLSEVWLASTDADSRVPAAWLEAHRTAAASGADVYLGTVALGLRDRREAQAWVDAYEQRARQDAVHGHVHGANLGVRALAYDLVGGFTSLALSEDADLVRRLVSAGATVAWCAESPVTTSARRDGRARGGVASDISAIMGQTHGSMILEGGAA